MVSVVLLGAGASFGSGDVFPHTPPLGNNLFAQLERHGGVAAQLDDRLKQLFRGNFEAGMGAFATAKNNDTMTFQRELARYIAQFVPGKNNVYRRLISELGVRRVIYCSLNYDLLFEQSAAQLGHIVIYGIDRPRFDFVRLLKPHGSCNAWPDLGGGKFIDCGGTDNVVDVVAPIITLNRQQTLERCEDRSFAPSMSMYAEGKAVKISPEWVNTQQQYWFSTIARASSVFVVGVRVHQADEHIWSVLGRSRAPITYYGYSDNDQREFAAWKTASGKRNAYFVQADFDASVTDMRKRLTGR